MYDLKIMEAALTGKIEKEIEVMGAQVKQVACCMQNLRAQSTNWGMKQKSDL